MRSSVFHTTSTEIDWIPGVLPQRIKEQAGASRGGYRFSPAKNIGTIYIGESNAGVGILTRKNRYRIALLLVIQ
jgi:hypothetical protein